MDKALDEGRTRQFGRRLLRIPRPQDQALFLLVAIPLIFGSQAAVAIAESRLGPFERIGWAWQLLLSLPVAALLVLAVGGLCWLVFARSSARELLTFCVLFAMPVLAYRLVGYANVAFDRAPGVLAEIRCVRSVPYRRGWRPEVTSWHDPSRTEQLSFFPVPSDSCTGAHVPFPIRVHPGRLGAEWISPAP